jgi:hypothetical protein
MFPFLLLITEMKLILAFFLTENRHWPFLGNLSKITCAENTFSRIMGSGKASSSAWLGAENFLPDPVRFAGCFFCGPGVRKRGATALLKYLLFQKQFLL